jgi:hypothetical protein
VTGSGDKESVNSIPYPPPGVITKPPTPGYSCESCYGECYVAVLYALKSKMPLFCAQHILSILWLLGFLTFILVCLLSCQPSVHCYLDLLQKTNCKHSRRFNYLKITKRT